MDIVTLCVAIIAVSASIGFAVWTWFAVNAAGAELLDIAGLEGTDFEFK